VVIGATSKWQSDGRNTLLAHGHPVDDSALPVGIRWGVRRRGCAEIRAGRLLYGLDHPQRAERRAARGGDPRAGRRVHDRRTGSGLTDSIAGAFATIRKEAGDPDVLVYNAGYLEGRDLPPEQELLEYIPVEMFDTTQHIACRGRSWSPRKCCQRCAKRRRLVLLFQQLQFAARQEADDRPVAVLSRVMMRTLAQC